MLSRLLTVRKPSVALGEELVITAGKILKALQDLEHKGYHFVRGGCWDDGPSSVRCAYRGWYLPPGSGGVGPGDSDYIGFRVAR